MTSYDTDNRELRTSVDYFLGRRDNDGLTVLSIVWKVDSGGDCKAGDELGTVQWKDNSRSPLVCPAGCSGTVAEVNRDITYEVLARRSQWLLRLKA